MTKNKDRKPDGWIEFFSNYDEVRSGQVFSSETGIKNALARSKELNLKTVAIGRIYLKNPNPST